MNRSSRRATLFAWMLVIVLVLPLLAACGGGTPPAVEESPPAEAPPAEEPPAVEASPPAESPAAEASPPAESPVAAAPEPAEVPLNDKVFVLGYNQSPDTLFALETSSSIVFQVLVGTGLCLTELDYDYQPTYCYDEFPTFDNGGAVTETVQVNPDEVSEENPIVIEGNLITDTAMAEEAGIEIPEELPQLTLTFNIAQDLYWEDGEQVTAADSVEMFRILKDPERQAVSTYTIDRIQNVEAQDDFTVVQTYVPGYLDWDYYTTFVGFMPEHVYGGQSIAEIRDQESTDPYAFGPYMVEEHIPAEQTTLVNNPYWQGDVNIGTIIYRYLTDSDQVLAQLETGEIDYAGSIGLTLDQIPQLEDLEAQGAIEFQSVPATVWEHIDFGIQRADGQESFFDDVRVRQAVAYAINRQQIIDEALYGRTTAMNTYVPSEHPSYPGDDQLEAYEYNPDRARELLEEAGWTEGADGIREQDGRRFSVSFYTTEGNRQREAASVVIQQNLAEVGIEVDLQFVPATEVLFLQGEEGILYGRRFDMALYAWVSGAAPSHLLYVSEQCPGPENNFAGQNNPCYQNPEFDEAARRALNEIDIERKRELDAEPLIIYNRDLPSFPLYQRPTLVAYDAGVSGVEINPSSSEELYNIHEIDIEQ